MRNIAKYLSLAVGLAFSASGQAQDSVSVAPHPIMRLLEDSLGASFIKTQEFDYYTASAGFLAEMTFKNKNLNHRLDKRDRMLTLAFYAVSRDGSKVFATEIERDDRHYKIYTSERQNKPGTVFNGRSLAAVVKNPQAAAVQGFNIYKGNLKR